MNKLDNSMKDLMIYLTNTVFEDCNIIRKHSKKLEQLGDLSFPLNINNWHQFLISVTIPKEVVTVLDYKNVGKDIDVQCSELIKASEEWSFSINKVIILSANAHIFFNRSSDLCALVLKEVFNTTAEYGSGHILRTHIKITPKIDAKIHLNCDLTILRLKILLQTGENLIKKLSINTNSLSSEIEITLDHKSSNQYNILCGPVLNDKGTKNTMTSEQLYKKRASDMRMMAQHKYGVQINKIGSWENYFNILGKACVTIEMLSNKTQKPIKISLNDLQTANKGASFIFYNCARIATLLKEFEKRVQNKIYPELPDLLLVDFSGLNQPEEWELFYVYIVQYPTVTKSCIRDIEKGILNPHYLVTFLSNLCSTFSAYYRRIRILMVNHIQNKLLYSFRFLYNSHCNAFRIVAKYFHITKCFPSDFKKLFYPTNQMIKNHRMLKPRPVGYGYMYY